MELKFFRIIRTSSSEAYGIIDDQENVIGRFDLHYANDGRIDAVVTVQKDLNKEDELSLIQKIDLDLVENAELDDENFNITFFKATESRIYGKEE